MDRTPPELDITTFLNLMVALVPFLLVTAVFSRITILELDMPSANGGKANEPKVSIEVIVRNEGLEIGNGVGVLASIPKVGNEYDLKKLSGYLEKIKANYPDKTDATVLLEPDIEYDHMISVMDAVRFVELPQDMSAGKGVMHASLVQAELFPDISIGDAP